MEARCMNCKANKEIQDPRNDKNKNGVPLVRGTCPDCGKEIFKINAKLEDEA